jgi:hypothetical protein
VAETEAGSSSGKLVEMQPSGQGLGVLPVRVLMKICMPSLRHNTRRRVLSFWMLQSARVRPSSSCLPADRNLHLEGNGFVVLERDNLAVEGGP